MESVSAITRHVMAQLIIRNDEPGPELTSEFDVRALKSCIKDARLFIVEPELLFQLYEAGEISMEKREPVPSAPDRLPFETVYVDAAGFAPTQSGDELLGYILSLRGGVFRAWTFNRDRAQRAFFLPVHTVGKWHGEQQAGGFVVPQLVAALNHQPPVASPLSFAERRHWGRLVKGSGTYPQPYYHIRTPAFRIDSQGVAPAAQAHAAPGYRFDVRAHQRLLCYRGPAPIADQDRASLEQRGYEVFASALPERWGETMTQRGHDPLKADEWVALRLVNVRESIRGAAHLPYVPSARVQGQP